MNTIEIELFEKNTLWFEKFTPENLDTEIDIEINEDGENVDVDTQFKLGCLFDYATFPDNKWEFYCDVFVKLPHVAAVMIRSQYKVYSADFEWDNLFIVENIKPVLTDSITNALIDFKDICIENSVALTTEIIQTNPELPDEMIDLVCKNSVDEYLTHRKPNDIVNSQALKEIELRCPMSLHINITLNLTFLVMEQILFNNNGFNRRQNQEVFFKIVPEVKFYTLRMKCIQIGQHQVDLTVMDVHFFLICLDCAIQIVLGDKGDSLIPVLEQRGVTDEIQKVWFKSATDLLHTSRKSVADSMERDEKFEWSKMIS